jgi:hypothetical protein
LFGTIEPDGEGIDRHANFKNFLFAFLTLFRITTGDAWEELLYSCRKHESAAPVYFISFVIIGNMIMVNLFIAVILVSARSANTGNDQSRLCCCAPMHCTMRASNLCTRADARAVAVTLYPQENFSETLANGAQQHRLEKIHTWVEQWQKIDRHAVHYIPASRLLPLMRDVSGPFGFRDALASGPMTKADILRNLKKFDIPVYVVPASKFRMPRKKVRREPLCCGEPVAPVAVAHVCLWWLAVAAASFPLCPPLPSHLLCPLIFSALSSSLL